MQRSSRLLFAVNRSGSAPGLLARLFGLALGLVVFVAAIVVGGLVLLGVAGVVLITAVTVMLRIWWLRRKFPDSSAKPDDLPGEFTVIREEQVTIEQDDRRPF